MAFFRDEEEENQQQAGPQEGPVSTGAASSIISGGGAGPGSASAGAKPDSSGRFVNLKSYLDANKTQAGKLGDQTAGVINNSANQARQGVAGLNQAADQQIKGVNSLSDDVSNKITTGAEGLTADERNQVKQTASAQYRGPQNEQGLGDAYTNASKASQTANQNIQNAGTEQGRMNLIGQVNSKPRTAGMNTFDNALLQAGGGAQKVQQAAQANQDVKGALDQSVQGIRSKIGRADDPNTPDVDESAGAIGQTNKAQADAQKKVTDAMNAWKAQFQPKVQQAQQSLVNRQNSVVNDLADNPYGLDADTLSLLGLDEGTQTYGVDLGSYFDQVSPTDINAANLASAEDYARYGALADLAGDQSLILRPEDASLAGTAKTNPSFRKDELLSAIAAAKDPYIANAKESSPASKYGATGRYSDYNYSKLLQARAEAENGLRLFPGDGDLTAALNEVNSHIAMFDQNVGKETAIKRNQGA